jgi:hypothetical protein
VKGARAYAWAKLRRNDMRFFRTGILVAVVLLAGAAIGFAQTDTHDVDITISEIQAIEAELASVVLTAGAPIAGNPVSGDSDVTDLYYTLLDDDATNTITASIPTDFTGGVGLGTWHVEVAATTFAGQGTSTGAQTLDDDAAVTIINAIQSVATTRTNGTCPFLTYTLVIDDSSGLTPVTNETRTVTLTLVDS